VVSLKSSYLYISPLVMSVTASTRDSSTYVADRSWVAAALSWRVTLVVTISTSVGSGVGACVGSWDGAGNGSAVGDADGVALG
jgi:hypothetical protein